MDAVQPFHTPMPILWKFVYPKILWPNIFPSYSLKFQFLAVSRDPAGVIAKIGQGECGNHLTGESESKSLQSVS